METPRWMVWASNVAAIVLLVGGGYLAVQVSGRLRNRVIPKPFPSLAQLADSARRRAPEVSQDTTGARPGVVRLGAVRSLLGGSGGDSLMQRGQRALGLGRWGDAAAAFDALWRDSVAGRTSPGAPQPVAASAALASSLLAAWRLDEPAARRAAARAMQLRGQLAPSVRRWLEAHQRWLAGDIYGSDSVYRLLLIDEQDDPTLWYAAAFVHRHDGGIIDSALIAYGSPAGRALHDQPARRVSHGGAIPALWRVLQLSPWHEAARLELMRFASLYADRPLANWLAWGAELYAVEPATRLAMRVLAADAKRDSAAWQIVLRLADMDRPASDVFAASRALATSAGVLVPRALWHAAELLRPLTNASRHPREVVAMAHAWRGQMLFAAGRPVGALDEFRAAAAVDSSLGLPLAAWTAWLSAATDTATLRAERATIRRWSGKLTSAAARGPWSPHAGMEPHLKAYAIGLLAAALGDTTDVRAQAEALDSLPRVEGDSTLSRVMADALRGELALARGDFGGAVAATASVDGLLPPLWREASPFSARAHARYRRAFAQQRAWQNDGARIAFVAFFAPTVPELPLYRSVRQRFDDTP